jgi:branched-chain amino acid transport system substrate-binding protein
MTNPSRPATAMAHLLGACLRHRLACIARFLLAVACGTAFASATAAAEATPIRIGLIAPLTGSSADFGISMRRGAELAVSEINAVGGYLGRPLELVVRDDRGDPASGRAAALDLAGQGDIAATIGFCNTGVAMAALDVFESHRQVLMVPCAQGTAITHRTPAASSFVFRVAPPDALNAAFLAGEIVDRRRLTRVAILADTTGYGDGGVADISAQLRERGLSPAYVGRFALGVSSLRGELEAARAAGAQALVVYTVGPGESVAVGGRAAMKWDVPYFAPWTLSFRSVLAESGAQALEGTMMTQSLIQDSANESRTSFVLGYARKFGVGTMDSLMAAAQSYDAVQLLLRAMFATHGVVSGAALKSALEEPAAPYRGVVTTYDHPFSPADHEAFSLNMIWLGVWRGGEIRYFYANDARLSGAVRHKQDR